MLAFVAIGVLSEGKQVLSFALAEAFRRSEMQLAFARRR